MRIDFRDPTRVQQMRAIVNTPPTYVAPLPSRWDTVRLVVVWLGLIGAMVVVGLGVLGW